MPSSARSPYAGHDAVSSVRFAGLVWIVFGIVLAAVMPFAAEHNTAVLAGGIGAGLLALGGGVLLARGAVLPYTVLLCLGYAGVGVVATIQLLAGSQGGALLTELYLGLALQTAALHPPRRTAGVLIAIGIAAVAQESRAGWTTEGAAGLAMQAGIWLFVAIIANVLVGALREQRSSALAEEALAQTLASTDALTGLDNRRRLLADLDRLVAERTPTVLALFDLDGFKAYNDSFGHPAGDTLLRRLGSDLLASLAPGAGAYRMGGDEFCLLTPEEGGSEAIAAAADALSDHGDGFTIGSSFGAVWLPAEAADSEEALRMADRRMYAAKSGGRVSAGRQSTDVLLRVLHERDPALGDHVDVVTELCDEVAQRLGIDGEERISLLQAAALHDVGKAAIPDGILDKAGPLDEEEWCFIRQHTVMGERIMAAAPSLNRASEFVRSSHEHVDGGGYPDGLVGAQIPRASRVIAVCDAYDAMTSERPYRVPMADQEALAELRRCAGSQFDPEVVAALEGVLDLTSAPSPA